MGYGLRYEIRKRSEGVELGMDINFFLDYLNLGYLNLVIDFWE